MIAVDASILVGLLRAENDVEPLAALLRDQPCVIGAPTFAEALVWCAVNLQDGRSGWLDAWGKRRNVKILSFDAAMAWAAQDAFRRFGRASGHPARLNFGDALSYAAAAAMQAPLLFKGADFGLTDAEIHPASVRL